MILYQFDLNSHQSISVQALPFQKYDCVISMGCGDDCPMIDCNLREDWQIPDPKHLSNNEFRIVRDYIEIKVKDLMQRIDAYTNRD